VFTLPARMAAIAWQNKAVIYDLLFRGDSDDLPDGIPIKSRTRFRLNTGQF
jgi:hypothetical protein